MLSKHKLGEICFILEDARLFDLMITLRTFKTSFQVSDPFILFSKKDLYITNYCDLFYKNIFIHPYVYVWIGLCFISGFLNANVSTIEILLNLCVFHLHIFWRFFHIIPCFI